ncbi:hypothetical protein B0H16DRAFT_1519145 [Mycena metata]|uniref:Uncharacterized protein n=1 Tax=Mycena metata TaxID=1033252 RepID=A0AAD7JNA0_9AGAR|nr:hypothetical protein B0H16DRAFT_1519145 [Mycena metata]
MDNAVNLAPKPPPWPWQQPSILNVAVEDELRPANSWLDVDLGEGEDDSSDYDPAEGSGSDSESTDDSDQETDVSSSISESELAYLVTAADAWERRSRTGSEEARNGVDDLILSIAPLLEAEREAAAAYDPDEIVSLITQFYELLIAMGHWPEGSLRYAPHTNPPLNEELAVQLGYTPAAISLMKRLPYLSSEVNQRHSPILGRSVLADYTRDADLKEGRRPYPYMYNEDGPDLDPWLVPWMLPGRDGSHVILDTTLGAVRAYCVDGFRMPEDTVEWQRHGTVPWEEAALTEYRRAPFVPAARYFTELIYAYRSLARLPLIDPDCSDPSQELYAAQIGWLANKEREEHETLLTLYRECGWPDQWRRSEFLERWTAEKEQIEARARKAM